MRNKIVAGNWKMNLSFQQANALVHGILQAEMKWPEDRLAIIAAPFPYLQNIQALVSGHPGFFTAGQNCHWEASGAFTGEVSAGMLHSIGVSYVIIGHSERRQYFAETNEILAMKLDRALESGLHPIFCCGEPLEIREAGTAADWVSQQLEESLFHLNNEQVSRILVAYEPVWAIGTGLTATAGQAQDMHATIRDLMGKKFGSGLAGNLPILYGGSCKPSNAKQLFGCPDVDGGLIGGASLVASDFLQLMNCF